MRRLAVVLLVFIGIGVSLVTVSRNPIQQTGNSLGLQTSDMEGCQNESETSSETSQENGLLPTRGNDTEEDFQSHVGSPDSLIDVVENDTEGEPEKQTSSDNQAENEERQVSLYAYAWNDLPTWDLIDSWAANLSRSYPEVLKGVSPRLVWGERREEARNIIQENLESRRIGTNVWDINLMSFSYREGRFWPPVPEDDYGRAMDEVLRVLAANGVIAKRSGFAVHLALGFLPEHPFTSKAELVDALEQWCEIVETTASIAERYKFEYLAPCSELDHVIRFESDLRLSEDEVRELYNSYSVRYRNIAKKLFSGKIEAKLGDVFPGISETIKAYDFSGADLVGFATGSPVNRDPESFREDLTSQIETMREVARVSGLDWYVSEVWIFGQGEADSEGLGRQAQLYQVFCDAIRDTECEGVNIRFWNLREEGLWSDIMDTPSEDVVATLFSSWTS